MVRAVNATFQEPEIALDCVRRNVPSIFITGIFLFGVRHYIVIWKIIMDEVVDHIFVGLDNAACLDVGFQDRLYVRQRHALHREGTNLAALTIY